MPVEAKGCDYMWNKHYYICYLYICVCTHVLICFGTHMEVRGQLAGVDSVSTLQVPVILLRSSVLLVAPLPSEPTCQSYVDFPPGYLTLFFMVNFFNG